MEIPLYHFIDTINNAIRRVKIYLYNRAHLSGHMQQRLAWIWHITLCSFNYNMAQCICQWIFYKNLTLLTIGKGEVLAIKNARSRRGEPCGMIWCFNMNVGDLGAFFIISAQIKNSQTVLFARSARYGFWRGLRDLNSACFISQRLIASHKSQ